MLESPFNTSFPSFSIFDGGVSYGAVDSMLFSGLSSVGNRPLDSYMSELDHTLDLSGNGWSARSSNYSRFLDSSPLSMTRNFMTWGWGGDWGMNHYLLALSRPYYNPFADIFSQFQFSPPDGSAFNFNPTFPQSTFPQSTIPRSTIPNYGTYAPSSRSGSSSGTTRTIREKPKAVTPGPVPVSVETAKVAEGISGDGSKAGKPKIETAVEDINGKRHPVMALRYNEKVRKDNGAVKKLATRLADELNKNKDLIVVVGGERFSADETFRSAGVKPPSELENSINKEIEYASQPVVKNDGDLNFGAGANARTFVKSPGFMVNTDAKGHYYVDASREEGEQIIAGNLISKGTKEEAWVYAEYTDETGFHKRWFECGIEEEGGRVRAELNVLSSLQEGTNVRTISVYHQHPLKEKQSGYSWPSDGDLLSANDRKGVSTLIPLDSRVITREGVYSMSAPSEADAAVIKGKVTGDYNKKIKKAADGNADSPHTGTVSATGLNCNFRYFDKPAEDSLASAPEEMRKFVAEYATPGTSQQKFDLAWTSNNNQYFILKDGVSAEDTNKLFKEMRASFENYDNSVYVVAADKQTYSLREPTRAEQGQGIKNINEIIADAAPAATEPASADPVVPPEPPASPPPPPSVPSAAAQPAEPPARPAPPQVVVPTPTHASPTVAFASPVLPRWLAGGNGEKFNKPYVKDNGIKEFGDEKYREIKFLYKKGSDVAGNADPQSLDTFVRNVTSLLRRRTDLVVVIGSYKFSSNPKLADQDGIRDVSFLDSRAFKTAVSWTRVVTSPAAEIRPESSGRPVPSQTQTAQAVSAPADTVLPKATDSGDITVGGVNFKHAEGFGVNTSSEHYYIDADIETGKSAIAKLVMKDKEELFAYVEYRDKDGSLKKRWFECGIDEQKGSVKPEKGFIRNLISDLGPKNITKIAFGHQHPLFNERGEKCGFNPPSRADMINAIDIVGEMSETGIDFSFFVADAAGIYVFSPTKELFAELDLNSSSFSLGRGKGPVSERQWKALAEGKADRYNSSTERLICSDPEEIKDAMEAVGFKADTFEYISPEVKKLVELYKELRNRHVNIRDEEARSLFDDSKDRYGKEIANLLGMFTEEEQERFEIIITDIKKNASRILGKEIQVAAG